MGYVESNLMPDEVVEYSAKLHWAIYIIHVFLMLIVIGFLTILAPIIQQLTTEMVITNRRIIIKTGWISRKTLEMNLGKIETLSVDQSIFGRIFGFGTITVVGTGGTREPFSMIADPLAFRNKFNEISSR